MIKKLLCVIGAVFLCFMLWFVFSEEKDDTVLPEKPSGTESGFYYENLDDTEKIAYELIMAEIENLPKKIQIPNLDDEGLSDVFEALLYSNPTYFFLSDNCKIETNRLDKTYFVPGYSMTAFEYVKEMTEIEEVKNEVFGELENIADDFEKERIIHDYVTEKCKYIEKTGGTYSSLYGCLVMGESSCEGYAKTMKYLLDECGIENYLATGTTQDENGETQGHAWNIVKIEGEYYHLDATWNDPEDDSAPNRYAYFNITDEDITITHNVEERFLGRCTADNNNYYVRNSTYFSDYDSHLRSEVSSELAKQIKLGNNFMSFRMADKESLKEAEEELFQMNGIYSIIILADTMTSQSIARDNIMYAIDEKHNIIIITDFLE